MNFHLELSAVAILSAGAMAAACSSKNSASPTTAATVTSTSSSGGNTGGSGGMGGTTSSTGGAGGAMPPPPPKLGAQIDRMGRPAINTVGSKTFIGVAEREAAEDAYNADGDPNSWKKYGADIAVSLAILDGVDTVCGNQPGSAGAMTKGGYDFLAGALADDRLRVRTDGDGTCGVYLGVEADALKLLPNKTCGGRTPVDDVIDESYSILSGAADFTKANPFPVGDKVPVDKLTSDAFAGGFPFFAPPH